MMAVGVVAPGAMGAVVGGCRVDKGTPVLWASERRSDTVRDLAALVEPTARFVDGGIIGSPPHVRGSTRLHLAGGAAAEVAALFSATALDAVVLDAAVPAASALTVADAAWTKGSAALPPDDHQGAAATDARLEARRDLSGTTVDEVVPDLLGA